MVVVETDSGMAGRPCCSVSCSGCLGGTLIDIGLDGVMAVFFIGFWGVSGDGARSITVDALSDALKESTLLLSASTPDNFLEFDVGKPLACSTFTSVLA